MRKRLKIKKHSCKMCKPYKMGWSKRWKSKDEAKLMAFERYRASGFRDAGA